MKTVTFNAETEKIWLQNTPAHGAYSATIQNETNNVIQVHASNKSESGPFRELGLTIPVGGFGSLELPYMAIKFVADVTTSGNLYIVED